jgi:small subunit ribosomal protein S9
VYGKPKIFTKLAKNISFGGVNKILNPNISILTMSEYFYGVGRRKCSVARAKYYKAETELVIMVNKIPVTKYFQDFYCQAILIAATKLGITTGKLDFFVKGGGVMGQAEACRLALAKSLVKMDEGYRPVARLNGYITTDIRQVLPKKAGKRKARKSEQWSKR